VIGSLAGPGTTGRERERERERESAPMVGTSDRICTGRRQTCVFGDLGRAGLQEIDWSPGHPGCLSSQTSCEPLLSHSADVLRDTPGALVATRKALQ
jgi:hypothetical protein